MIEPIAFDDWQNGRRRGGGALGNSWWPRRSSFYINNLDGGDTNRLKRSNNPRRRNKSGFKLFSKNYSNGLTIELLFRFKTARCDVIRRHENNKNIDRQINWKNNNFRIFKFLHVKEEERKNGWNQVRDFCSVYFLNKKTKRPTLFLPSQPTPPPTVKSSIFFIIWKI